MTEVWHTLSKSAKLMITFAGLLALGCYTLFISWATIKINLANAYDERWYYLDAQKQEERTLTINSIQTDITLLKSDFKNQRDDIRDIRSYLMGPKK